MRAPRTPLFLARGHYRRRRRHDAARLLPVVGVFLLLLPLFHGPGAGMVVFVLAVWVLLIVVAAVLAPGLAEPDAEGGTAEDEG